MWRRDIEPWRRLTPRHKEIIRRLATGMTNPEIGRELGISLQTVKNHLRAAYNLAGVNNRVEMANFAAAHGLTDAPDETTAPVLHTSANGGTMEYSLSGLQLTERFEGCRLQAYYDSTGVATIGYGHTFGVKIGDTCTQAQAVAWLEQDVATAEAAVNQMVRVPLKQNEFDALVDFVFNLGAGNFEQSTMLRKLNAGDYAGAALEFAKWDRAGGVELAGLLRRRQAEAAEFTSAG